MFDVLVMCDISHFLCNYNSIWFQFVTWH